MSDFTFKLFFLPGKFNKIADICSRSPNVAFTPSEKSALGLPDEDDSSQSGVDITDKTDETTKTANETNVLGKDLKQHWLPDYIQNIGVRIISDLSLIHI